MGRLHVHYKDYTQLNGKRKKLVQRVGSGSIIKRFDRTPLPQKATDVVCPHFLELKWAYGCPYRCAWCYLQGTLRLLPTKTKPVVKDYKRIEKHLIAFFDETCIHYDKENGSYPNELLNTGELADSLMWEKNGNPFSEFILDLFSTQDKHSALFLSKSDAIDNIIKQDFEKLVTSFTINSNAVSRQWEQGAPHPNRRIKAAATLSKCGYPVRIRIDPLVPIRQWKKAYSTLLDRIFSEFVPERITLGSLRGLQSTIINSRDSSWTSYLTEKSNWGRKVTYKKRKEIYAFLIEYLIRNFEYTQIALCKETIEMWEILGLNHSEIMCNCIL